MKQSQRARQMNSQGKPKPPQRKSKRKSKPPQRESKSQERIQIERNQKEKPSFLSGGVRKKGRKKEKEKEKERKMKVVNVVEDKIYIVHPDDSYDCCLYDDHTIRSFRDMFGIQRFPVILGFGEIKL